MKVLFIKEVPGVAHAGEIKEVAEGYARNFLLPNRAVRPVTEANIKEYRRRLKTAEVRVLKRAHNVKEIAKKLVGFRIEIKAKADETGKLYGSVTASKVAEVLSKLGYQVKPDYVKLEAPIKKIGNHPAKLVFDSESQCQILVTVNKE